MNGTREDFLTEEGDIRMNGTADSVQGGRKLRAHHLGLTDYGEAWELQKSIVKQVDSGERDDTLLLLEHPPTYTIGSQRHPEHLLLSPEQLKAQGIAVYQIDRGGDITYHGPGQLVGYPLLLLEGKRIDLHGYLRSLEEAIIRLLASFGIEGSRKPEYTGVWVGDVKLAAIGVKFNKCSRHRGFVTSHGFALNVKSGIQASGFSGIVPCGISKYGVTSLEDCTGMEFTVEDVGRLLLPYLAEVLEYDEAIVEPLEARSR